MPVGLGDRVLKKRLSALLKEVIGPIRESRNALAADIDFVRDVIRVETSHARETTQSTLEDFRIALGLYRS